jgi:hypothetical protein
MPHRLHLRRALRDGADAPPDPVLGWILLNPSTADAERDDPTICRVTAFSRSWGAGGLQVANLYPLRATDPAALWAAPEALRLGDAERADAAIAELCRSSAAVVLAWGAQGARCPGRVRVAIEVARAAQVPLVHLGLTRGGQPRHPLYVKGLTPLVEVDAAALVGMGGDG